MSTMPATSSSQPKPVVATRLRLRTGAAAVAASISSSPLPTSVPPHSPCVLERTPGIGSGMLRPGRQRIYRAMGVHPSLPGKRSPRARVTVVLQRGRAILPRCDVTLPGSRKGAGMSNRPFSSIEAALEDVRAGKMVVVCDAEDRENEGDLTLAAQFATPQSINFMATHGRGLICLALTPERCDELGLDLMAAKNESPFQTAFTVSVEAREGISTGISAHDRARTVQVAIDPSSRPQDLVQPGHIFPLKAKAGGVLERTGQTEAAVDLARLAGLNPAGVICE